MGTPPWASFQSAPWCRRVCPAPTLSLALVQGKSVLRASRWVPREGLPALGLPE